MGRHEDVGSSCRSMMVMKPQQRIVIFVVTELMPEHRGFLPIDTATRRHEVGIDSSAPSSGQAELSFVVLDFTMLESFIVTLPEARRG